MRNLPILLILLTACTTTSAPTTSSSTTTSLTTTTTVPTTTTFPDLGVEICDPPDFVIPALPEGLSAENIEISQLATDRFTSIPGSSVAFWADGNGDLSMAFLRGSLPVEPWTGATERVNVRGFQGALGPLSDGVWAVAWFESETACDSYTLLFYPPLGPIEARQVAESIRDR